MEGLTPMTSGFGKLAELLVLRQRVSRWEMSPREEEEEEEEGEEQR